MGMDAIVTCWEGHRYWDGDHSNMLRGNVHGVGSHTMLRGHGDEVAGHSNMLYAWCWKAYQHVGRSYGGCGCIHACWQVIWVGLKAIVTWYRHMHDVGSHVTCWDAIWIGL